VGSFAVTKLQGFLINTLKLPFFGFSLMIEDFIAARVQGWTLALVNTNSLK